MLQTYKSIPTEIPYQENIQLQDLSTSELVKLLWKAEQEAGEWLEKSFPVIEQAIDEISDRVNKGGRIIYVGSGTSGRIAAMDAVEIPCTYGFPEDRILCLIAGGIADAAIEIESDFEEDASSVPEILLMNITTRRFCDWNFGQRNCLLCAVGTCCGKRKGSIFSYDSK